MIYTIEQVPTFLLYDALSWCIKNKQVQANFFKSINGVREDLFCTPDDIHEELHRRKSEILNPSIVCVKCGDQTDGRCHFTPEENLCSQCYWHILKSIATGTLPKYSPKVIETHKSKKITAQEPIQLQETREEVALRMGLPLKTLESTGFFD